MTQSNIAPYKQDNALANFDLFFGYTKISGPKGQDLGRHTVRPQSSAGNRTDNTV